jgi:hypothetical protein
VKIGQAGNADVKVHIAWLRRIPRYHRFEPSVRNGDANVMRPPVRQQRITKEDVGHDVSLDRQTFTSNTRSRPESSSIALLPCSASPQVRRSRRQDLWLSCESPSSRRQRLHVGCRFAMPVRRRFELVAERACRPLHPCPHLSSCTSTSGGVFPAR